MRHPTRTAAAGTSRISKPGVVPRSAVQACTTIHTHCYPNILWIQGRRFWPGVLGARWPRRRVWGAQPNMAWRLGHTVQTWKGWHASPASSLHRHPLRGGLAGCNTRQRGSAPPRAAPLVQTSPIIHPASVRIQGHRPEVQRGAQPRSYKHPPLSIQLLCEYRAIGPTRCGPPKPSVMVSGLHEPGVPKRLRHLFLPVL